MSRQTQGSIGKRPDYRPLAKRPSKAERLDRHQRYQKKKFKEMGLIGDRFPIQWVWKRGEEDGVVEAFTRGEARGKVKEALSLPKNKRLPENINLARVEAPDVE
jgi:hypothetical protein